MGGTLEAPGNTSPTSEFNFFADPYAADIVLKAATLGQFDFVLVPLDITSRHTIPFDALIRSGTEQQKPSILRSLTDPILSRTRHVLAAWGDTTDMFEMHDPLAAYFVIEHGDLDGMNLKPGWTTAKRSFMIERTGEFTKGMCVVDRRIGTGEGSVRSRENIDVQEHPLPIAESANKEVDPDDRVLAVTVVSKSPGPDHFQKYFLQRVFGQ